MVTCPSCRSTVLAGAFCGDCGRPFPQTNPMPAAVQQPATVGFSTGAWEQPGPVPQLSQAAQHPASQHPTFSSRPTSKRPSRPPYRHRCCPARPTSTLRGRRRCLLDGRAISPASWSRSWCSRSPAPVTVPRSASRRAATHATPAGSRVARGGTAMSDFRAAAPSSVDRGLQQHVLVVGGRVGPGEHCRLAHPMVQRGERRHREPRADAVNPQPQDVGGIVRR